jgi:hypothetical protein
MDGLWEESSDGSSLEDRWGADEARGDLFGGFAAAAADVGGGKKSSKEKKAAAKREKGLRKELEELEDEKEGRAVLAA